MKEFKIRVLDSEFCDLSCRLLNSTGHSYSNSGSGSESNSSEAIKYHIKINYYCGLCVSEDRSLSRYLEHDNNTDNIHRCERCKEIFRV